MKTQITSKQLILSFEFNFVKIKVKIIFYFVKIQERITVHNYCSKKFCGRNISKNKSGIHDANDE